MDYRIVATNNLREVYFSGHFTFRDHDKFFEVINLIQQNPYSEFIFDLEEVNVLDSAVLGMLVIAHEEASVRKVKVSLRKPKGIVKEILISSRMNTLYTIAYDEVEEPENTETIDEPKVENRQKTVRKTVRKTSSKNKSLKRKKKVNKIKTFFEEFFGL